MSEPSWPTSLYAKLFINGFSKPSVIVVAAEARGEADAKLVREVFEHVVATIPLLRATVEFSWPELPLRFRPLPVDEWFARGGFFAEEGGTPGVLDPRVRQELQEAPDPVEGPLFRARLLVGGGRTTFLLRLHHAIADAHTLGFLAAEFVRRYREQLGLESPTWPAADRHRPPVRERLDRALDLVRGASLRARVPDVSLIADLPATDSAAERPVCFSDLVLPADALRIGAPMGLTFAQASCVALLRALHTYNAHAAAAFGRVPPGRIGIMVAATNRWKRRAESGSVGFSADSRLVGADVAQLQRDPEALFTRVKEALRVRRDRHNLLPLAAFYVARRLRALAGPRPSAPVRSVHLMYSDVSSRSTGLRRPLVLSNDLVIERIRCRVSPVALDNVSLISYTYGSEMVFTLTYHEGVVDGDVLLSNLRTELESLGRMRNR